MALKEERNEKRKRSEKKKKRNRKKGEIPEKAEPNKSCVPRGKKKNFEDEQYRKHCHE